MKILLLPGMDGSGELFRAFIAALPAAFDPQVVRYPADRPLSYTELEGLVRSEIPTSEPFVLLAESFSTPLAIRLAATNPPNIRALVLCTGFATGPVRGWRRFMLSFLAPIVFRVPISQRVIRFFLVGSEARDDLVGSVCAAIRLVQPEILLGRLEDIFNTDVRSSLKQILVPTLYLQARQDRLVGSRSAQEIVDLNPRVRLLQIDGPHLLLQRMPEPTAKLIANFIEER